MTSSSDGSRPFAPTALPVWCTKADRVDAVVAGERHALERDGDWWQLPKLRVEPGTDYAFSLDGAAPLPDPRSAFQPHGVHGASRLVDHAAFEWNDASFSPAPLADALIYELHVGCFTSAGTFDAAIERLDHLVALGVTHVELMPVAAFAGERGWGYDGVALYAPHRAYGGPDGLKRFVNACHGRGLGVLLDVVYNHLGGEGNYLARYAPYFSGRYTTPWGPAFNFDGRGADEVRRFVCDNARMWLRDYHVDGFRFDATHAMPDRSALTILEQLTVEATEEGRARGIEPMLVAEHLTNDPWVVRSHAEHGVGMQAQWSDDFHHALHARLTGERIGAFADFGDLQQLARTLERGWFFEGQRSVYRRQCHGRRLDLPVGGHRLVGYSQNHDQVGNRALGERLVSLVGLARARIAAALTLFAPQLPLLFMGEEWGATTPFCFFTDYGDARLVRAMRKGRRASLRDHGFGDGADPQSLETFEASRLRWHEREAEAGRAMLAWYRELIALRRARPELRDGELTHVRVAFDDDAGWLAVQRGPLTLACNLGEAAQRLPVEGGRVLLASPAAVEWPELPPDGVALVEGAAGLG
jgi:maltooligosyltrehalose trehalohydrolase